MVIKLFLDTNVFIDAFAGREPFAKNAKLILALGSIGEFELWCSATQITDIFYVLSDGGKANRSTWAKEQIVELRKFVNVCAFTDEDIDFALSSTWKDFEDSCINQAAHKVKPDAVITGNVKDFIRCDFPVLDCNRLFDWIEEQEGISYRKIAFA